MVSQCTKFEVSRFTRYEATNGVQNAENGVVWGGLGGTLYIYTSSAMSPFDRAHTTSYSTLIETVRLSSQLNRELRTQVSDTSKSAS